MGDSVTLSFIGTIVHSITLRVPRPASRTPFRHLRQPPTKRSPTLPPPTIDNSPFAPMATTLPPVMITPTTIESTQPFETPPIVDSTTVPVIVGTPSFTTLTLQTEQSSSSSDADTIITPTTSNPQDGIHHSPPPSTSTNYSAPGPPANTNETTPFQDVKQSNNAQAAGNLAEVAVPSVIGGLLLFGALFAAAWWVFVVRVAKERTKKEARRKAKGKERAVI
ncbi:hypothetical protein B0J18DRAFT_455780 [Chaetomium sp. MPI-SDFR-AT-0129]|nr:hypothetical protein B0J18DRAFT_455780 [Chaetomium sp. MPI-SDFR-AT-0129]